MSDIAYKKALTQYLEGFVSERRLGRLKEVLEENQSYYVGFRRCLPNSQF